MPISKTVKTVAGIAVSFAGLAGTIVLLSGMKIISLGMAKLLLVGLLGVYVGLGILVAVYRLISKLD